MTRRSWNRNPIHLSRGFVTGRDTDQGDALCGTRGTLKHPPASALAPVTCGVCLRCWSSLPASVRQLRVQPA